MDPQALLDGLDIGIAAIAPDWTVIGWNLAAARHTGLPADRVLGHNFWIAFPSARGTHVEQILKDVLQDGQPRTYLLPSTDVDAPGTVFETHVSRGPNSHLLLAFRRIRQDIEQESRAAHLLRAYETERRLHQQLFSSLPVPALVLTVDGQILGANTQAAELLGAPTIDPLKGRGLADWAPAAQRSALRAALRDAVGRRQEFRLAIEFAGEPAREAAAVITNVDPDDPAAKLLFLAVDVSRETLLQQKLLRADRLAQLGALVSGVAHELNNPLAAISAFAELLTVDAPTPDVQESAGIIHAEAMRAGRVVQTLLDFARQRPRRSQPVDLQDVIERVLALHRNALKKARVRTVTQIPTDLPEVPGDPQELQQVILNAVLNGQQAIEDSGRPGTLTITTRRTDGHVMVTVEDTGNGVPLEIMDRIFEPFFTTKGETGTGLGLAISLGIVRAMGGRMYMHNLEEGGARLAIELPTGTPAEAVDRPFGAPQPSRHLSVLVVDDESAVRRGLSRMAERLGHTVTSAGGFEEARRQLGAKAARFDAVLLDVHLDDTKSGFDLFEALRLDGRGHDQRVIFTTGDSISAKTRDALQHAERPVLRKPFNLEELREMIERVSG